MIVLDLASIEERRSSCTSSWILPDICHPAPQAIARIYRYGQTKATFVYRLLYKGTAEHRVYRRNVDKEGLFLKVVDKETVKGMAITARCSMP